MNSEIKIWEETGIVRANECSPDGIIHIYAMMQYLQDAAAKHAQALGFGFHDLGKKACYWVLANAKIYISGLPKWNAPFTVRTWPSGFNRLKATREFIGIDEGGKEFLRASSEWMIIGKDTGHPLNLRNIDLGLVKNGERIPDLVMDRLKPEQDLKGIGKITVPYSALDINGHVNNTEYVKWVFDALHMDGAGCIKFKTYQFVYMAEVFKGDTLEILIDPLAQNKQIGIVVKRMSDDKAVFMAKLVN